ncbi:MAG: retropepsin-like aspartic protease family protein [Hyphomicrobium sp.]
MSVSSGTSSLFSYVGCAMALAFAGAWALKNPDQVYAVAKTALPAEWLSLNAPAATTDLNRANEPSRSASPYADVTLRAGDHGHFEADAEINGRSVGVMVDTGATMVALTYEDAERAGLFLRPADFTHQVSTANGVARIAPVTIDRISIGPITVRDVRGAVSERGKLHQTLLGMSFLGRLSRVDMRSGTLELHQ